MYADAKMYAGIFDGPQSANLAIDSKRKAYVHLIRGAMNANGIPLTAGDALLIENEAQVSLSQGENAEILVFDLTS